MESNFKLEKKELIQQILIDFEEDELTFNSKFDSGNLSHIERKSKFLYDLHIAADCQDLQEKKDNFRVWFFFKVSNTSKENKSLIFSIKNLSLFLKEIFTKGHLPVYHIDGTNEEFYDRKWSRLDKTLNEFVFIETTTGIDLNYKYDINGMETVYFAYSYPWSYSDNLTYIKTLKLLYKNQKNIYFNAECMINSLEERKIHFLTLTSKKFQTAIQEKTVHKYLFTKNPKKRPWIFTNKKYIVISARVHPGETPSSYILQGIIESILTKTQFLDNYVVVIVPMLNPDGVFRGYYRLDTNGKNLNRVFHSSYYIKYPSIFALKKIIHHLKTENRLFAYFDLHAHNIIDKSFLFGNNGENLEDQIEIMLLPKIMSLVLAKFEIKNCKFESKGIFIDIKKDENENIKNNENSKIDKNQDKNENLNNFENSKENTEEVTEEKNLKNNLNFKNEENQLVDIEKKEVFGIAKTYFFKNEGLKLSYTLECSYNGGYLTDNFSKEHKNEIFYFDRNGFKEVGKHLIFSILEFDGLNEQSILEPHGYKNVNELKQSLMKKNEI